MDVALCIVLLFAASATGRPLGSEIAKVCIFAKKNILLWAKEKKLETCRVKTDSTLRPHKPICVLKQVGQQTENEKRINYFQEGLKARGLSSRLAPKYCTLDKSADFFRYLGYKVSRKDDTDVMTD